MTTATLLADLLCFSVLLIWVTFCFISLFDCFAFLPAIYSPFSFFPSIHQPHAINFINLYTFCMIPTKRGKLFKF